LAVFITSVLSLASGIDGGLGGMAILSSQTYVSSIYWLCRCVRSICSSCSPSSRC
jgi:hypothetical protein